jgi:hypothetical protein
MAHAGENVKTFSDWENVAKFSGLQKLKQPSKPSRRKIGKQPKKIKSVKKSAKKTVKKPLTRRKK